MKFLSTLAIVASLLLSAGAYADDSQPSIWVFAGRAVSNSVTDEKSHAWGIYQETPTRFGRWDFGYVNEGHQKSSDCQTGGASCIDNKRDGIFALYDMQYHLNKNLKTSFAIGPYFTATTVTDPNGIDYQDAYRTDFLGKASLKYSLTNHWGVEASWWHVIYSTHDLMVHGRTARGDGDIFTGAVGYSF